MGKSKLERVNWKDECKRIYGKACMGKREFEKVTWKDCLRKNEWKRLPEKEWMGKIAWERMNGKDWLRKSGWEGVNGKEWLWKNEQGRVGWKEWDERLAWRKLATVSGIIRTVSQLCVIETALVEKNSSTAVTEWTSFKNYLSLFKKEYIRDKVGKIEFQG